MTKSELIEQALRIVVDGGERSINRTDMEYALDALCEITRRELVKGGEVSLPHLGKLKMKEMKARMGRNPRTGEPIMIPATRKVVFTPSKAFRVFF